MKKIKEFASAHPLAVAVALVAVGAVIATAFSKVRGFLKPAASKLPGADA